MGEDKDPVQEKDADLVRGQENDVRKEEVNQGLRLRDHEDVSLPCTGMFRHLDLSISRHCSTRPCKLRVRYRQI
ncbi:unnamed protein product [Leptidea sinapis]|uniref:Uncharacterized protein n=1 Tax=Leptidea sinapis TaxID=189913 RepID=A0A5E4PV70_9NEOP|nr:unnamed protein product [Leptidea sinapis]